MNFVFITLLMIKLFKVDHNDSADMADTFVAFRINNAGVQVTGIVEAIRVDINFNEKNLRESAVIAIAQVANIRTGISIRDKHLQRSDYFHADRYPEIVLTSTSFKKIARHKFLGTFILEIKDLKKEIAIPFSINQQENTLTYSGRFEINRLDFGLGEESLILDNVVSVFVSGRVK